MRYYFEISNSNSSPTTIENAYRSIQIQGHNKNIGLYDQSIEQEIESRLAHATLIQPIK